MAIGHEQVDEPVQPPKVEGVVEAAAGERLVESLLFGEPCFVMHLNLGPDRRLARVDTRSVLEHLDTKGYYLQLPPDMPVEEEITRRLSHQPQARRR